MENIKNRLVATAAVCMLTFVQFGFGAPGALRQNPSKPAGSQPSDDPADDEFQQAFTKARALAAHQEYKDAISEFQRAAALKHGDCADCYRAIGEANIHLKKYKDAAAAIRQALTLKPDNPVELYNALGVALFFDGDKASLNDAVAAFNQAIQLSHESFEQAYFNLGFALIKQGKSEEGVQALRTYLKLAPNGPDARDARNAIENPKPKMADSKGSGQKLAPDFKVKSITGDELSLAKFRGKIVLLDFWATWCGPCRQEMPAVKRVWAKYSNDNFVIIGVSLDKNRGALDEYLQSEGITWPQYYEKDGRLSVSNIYGVHAIPESVLIDQDGAIKAVGLRGPALYDKIGDLLKKLRKSEAKS
jgi:cytochrome c-type biogenesis protein CcmH/NrfG/thiol-disulfide isomerase/thioredoxin